MSLAMPAPLHDVLGARQSPGALALVLIAGIGLPVALALSDPAALTGVELWRTPLALLLIGDIAAGAVANFTAGTNDHYAERPRSRWIFIAVHLHLVALALLLDAPLLPAVVLWLATIAGAVAVNLLHGHPLQRPVGGLLLAGILVAISLLPGTPLAITPLFAAVAAVFALKVVYAFAVDHRPAESRFG